MSETKTPTAQDIEAVRSLVVTHLMSGLNKTPETVRQVAMLLDMSDRVLDYAAACLSAEVEAETVPTPAPAGTPVWVESRGVWFAYVGERMPAEHALYASDVRWSRYHDGGRVKLADSGTADDLAASIRAASASWNAAHPNLPPVIVPEQFREGPQVEPPEDVGDGAGRGAWIEWAGGGCPVHPDTIVNYECRSGTTYTIHAGALVWAHKFGSGDIVRYRIVQPDEPAPPQTPTERVAAMTNPQVEAFVTGEGVGPWEQLPRNLAHAREWDDPSVWRAISPEGRMVNRHGARYDDKTGDTTTPAGRMECTRRLAVHLMRETVS